MGVCIKVENKRNEKSIFIKGKKQNKKTLEKEETVTTATTITTTATAS